jgi:thimet oligopeptidase
MQKLVSLSIALLLMPCCATAPSARPEVAMEKHSMEPIGVAASRVSGAPDAFLAFTRGSLERAKGGIASLKAMAAPRSARAALELYDEATAVLSDASAQADVAKNASPNEALRAAAETADQEISKLSTEISLDKELYQALAGLDLSSEEEATRYWISQALREFRRAGVDRDDATRAKVKELNEELVRIGQEFQRNVREDVRKVSLDPADLDGLPADFVSAHLPGADGKVTVTTDYPDVFPMLSYAKQPKAREAIYRAFYNRAYPQNLAVLSHLLEKRQELASLLGYRNWAAYITENKMIGSAEAASAFIDKIAAAAEARSKADLAILLEAKRKDAPGAAALDGWDSSYYTDRVKAERYQFDSQSVRPYFEFSRVLQGVLDVTGRLFQLDYRQVSDAQVWHADVHVYDVIDRANGRTLGRIYLDLHPRDGKYKHAAQYTLVSGREGERLPEGVLLCNFPRPGGAPALMDHQDVVTLFHEFGHLLHHILGGHTRWAGLSGVRTEWDFVEAPSQMLEEWVRDPDVLQSFAKHYQTGAPIPRELVQKLRDADEFAKGVMVRRQMFYASMSLVLHERDPKGLDTTQAMADLQARYSPFPYVPGTYLQCSFGHLEGYSAIYYTYMWSLVIAKDLFTVFEQRGLFDASAAQRYRHAVLEPGGGKPAAQLVQDFLGRPYDFRAYQAWLDRG